MIEPARGLDLMPPPTQRHRNVHRHEHNYFRGYVVTLKRGGAVHRHYFNDHGDPADALERALRWRNHMIEKLPPPVKLHRTSSVNTTGHIGVSRTRERTRQGRLLVRYVALWNDTHGRRCKRSFSITKYGEDAARALAVAARHEAVQHILATRPKGPLPPMPSTRRPRSPRKGRSQ